MIKYACEYELTQGSMLASGYDLRAMCGVPRDIDPGWRWIFNTGLYLEVPYGVDAQIRPRSGLAAHHGVVAIGGTIDCDYRGECKVTLINHGQRPYTVLPGDRIAQLVFGLLAVAWSEAIFTTLGARPVRVENPDDLSKTSRGVSGHGSSGR